MQTSKPKAAVEIKTLPKPAAAKIIKE